MPNIEKTRIMYKQKNVVNKLIIKIHCTSYAYIS